MKEKVILLALLSLLLVGCNSGASYPSDPETVLKKGIKAIHNNDLNEINKYFYIREWDGLIGINNAIKENYPHLPNTIEVIRTKYFTHEGKENTYCYILANTTDRAGDTEQRVFHLEKKQNGKWMIHVISEGNNPGFSDYNHSDYFN